MSRPRWFIGVVALAALLLVVIGLGEAEERLAEGRADGDEGAGTSANRGADGRRSGERRGEGSGGRGASTLRAPRDQFSVLDYTWGDLEPGPVEGDTLALSGWVTDVAGRPVAGVPVSVGVTDTERGWRTVTDQGGRYAFERLPRTDLRLSADAGELGSATKWVQGVRERLEVSLVLEPTGVIIVRSEGGNGRVRLRDWAKVYDATTMEYAAARAEYEAWKEEYLWTLWVKSVPAEEDEAGEEMGEEGEGEEGDGDLVGEEVPEVASGDLGREQVRGLDEARAPEPSSADDELLDQMFDDVERLLSSVKAVYGPNAETGDGSSCWVVQRGWVDQPLRVRGWRKYEVSVLLDETLHGQAFEIRCGEVTVRPGEVVEVVCHTYAPPAPTQIVGRVVARDGRPLADALVAVSSSGEAATESSTVTDEDGDFALEVEDPKHWDCDVKVALDGQAMAWRSAERRRLRCRPGARVDVGLIVLHTEDEALAMEDEESERLRGLLMIEDGRIFWRDANGEGDLDTLGIEPWTELVSVDDEDATRLSLDEAVGRLTADQRARAVVVGLRSPEGDLMEAVLERPLFGE